METNKPIFSISQWNDRYDNIIQSSENLTWQDILEFIEEPICTKDKNIVGLWNMNTFAPLQTKDEATGKLCIREKALRRNRNCVAITGLVIDVDNDSNPDQQLSIEQAKEFFQKWTYAIIPSYRHLYNDVTEKYRIILPFNKPMPYHDRMVDHFSTEERNGKTIITDGEQDDDTQTIFRKRLKSLQQVVGWIKPENDQKSAIDIATFRPAQGFFLPSRPPGRHYFVIRNDGEFFDWETETVEQAPLPDRPAQVIDLAKTSQGGLGKIIARSFDIVAWFEDQGKYIRNLGGNQHQVCCPWVNEHTDRNPSGTVIYEGNVNETTPGRGYPNFHCAHSHGSWLNGFKLFVEAIGGEEAIRPYCRTREKKESIFLKDILNKTQDQAAAESADSILTTFNAYPQTLTLAPTGSGKSYNTCIKALEIIKADPNTRVFIFVTSKDQIKQVIELFMTLLKTQNVNEKGINYIVSGGGFKIGDNEATEEVRENFRIIVSHHGYIKRRGFYDRYFSVLEHIDESSVVFIDEVDSYIEALTQDIPLGTRYKESTINNKKYFTNVAKCPQSSRSGNCTNCINQDYRNRLNLNQEYNVYSYEPLSRYSEDQSFNNYEWLDLSKYTDAEPQKYNVRDSTEAYQLNETANCGELIYSDSEDRNRNIDVVNIIEDMIQSSWRPTVYRHFIRDEISGDEVSTDQVRGFWNPDKDALELPEEVKFPYYACNVLHVITMDKRPLLHMAKAKRLHLMTATISPNQQAFIQEMVPAIKVYQVEPWEDIRMENITVIGTCKSFINEKHLIDVLPSLKAALVFQPTKERALRLNRHLSKNIPQVKFGVSGSEYHIVSQNNVNDVDILVTHSRGTLGRGINLPQYHWVFVNAQTYKPIASFPFLNIENLAASHYHERAAVFIQNIGRILRKRDAGDNGTRYIVIDGLEAKVEFKHITDKLQKMSKAPVKAIFLDEFVHLDSMQTLISDIHTGAPKRPELNITMDDIKHNVKQIGHGCATAKELWSKLKVIGSGIPIKDKEDILALWRQTRAAVKQEAQDEKKQIQMEEKEKQLIDSANAKAIKCKIL